MSPSTELVKQRYGKARVRVLRVVRHPDGIHTVHEVTASIMLHGEFTDAYLTDDNHQVVPTDTVKNTVHALAGQHLKGVIEDFALALGHHFLERYTHITHLDIELVATPWERYQSPGGDSHPHVFLGRNLGRPFTRVAMSREKIEIVSGVREVLLLKSTASAFKGFPRCEFTTLPETDDRILSTSMEANWTFADGTADFAAANTTIMTALLKTFASEFSPSVQNTLYRMGQAALTAAPCIIDISLAMPNKHYLPINLQPFGLANMNEIFLPTDEPHGQLEATFTRASP